MSMEVRRMANSTKKVIKKKTKKEKHKNQVKDSKVEKSKKIREEQFVKLEHDKETLQNRLQDQNVERLREALILAEIVGSPMCKARRSRGNSRRYGS